MLSPACAPTAPSTPPLARRAAARTGAATAGSRAMSTLFPPLHHLPSLHRVLRLYYGRPPAMRRVQAAGRCEQEEAPLSHMLQKQTRVRPDPPEKTPNLLRLPHPRPAPPRLGLAVEHARDPETQKGQEKVQDSLVRGDPARPAVVAGQAAEKKGQAGGQGGTRPCHFAVIVRLVRIVLIDYVPDRCLSPGQDRARAPRQRKALKKSNPIKKQNEKKIKKYEAPSEAPLMILGEKYKIPPPRTEKHKPGGGGGRLSRPSRTRG
jgi:hypothetical protein